MNPSNCAKDFFHRQGVPISAFTAQKYIRFFRKIYQDFLQKRKEDEFLTIVLFCRESRENGNLQDQINEVKELLIKYPKLKIKKVFSRVESGKMKDDRPRFRRALKYAKKHGAILVAESRDRFLRADNFSEGDKKNPDFPSQKEYEKLMEMAQGVILATLYHPDALPAEIRGLQTKRGHRAKNRKGGGDRLPGHKKRRKEKWFLRVLALHSECVSLSQITKKTGIPKTTVFRWSNEKGGEN